MGLTWTISHEDRLVHAIATDVFSTSDIQGYLGSVITANAMPYGKLFDMSQATSLEEAGKLAEVSDTVRLYDKMKLGAIGPLAIVIGDIPAHRHFAELFVRSATAARPVQMFNSSRDALEWLSIRKAKPTPD